MNIESIAEKIIPTVILAIIGATFTIYMDVQFLKQIASDYKARADMAHQKYERELENNTRDVIILKEQIKYLESQLSTGKD